MPANAPTPKAFAAECWAIVRSHTGDDAHRRLDRLVTDTLTALGYGEGMAIFLAAAAAAHEEK